MTPRAVQISAMETPPLCLHVYRVGSIWSDDKIVRADDRKTLRYYLKGTRLSASWQFGLYEGGQHGMLVCHVRSPYLGPPLMVTATPGPMTVTICVSPGPGSSPERHVIEVYRGRGSSLSGAWAFKGPDGRVYRWRVRSRLTLNGMECLDAQDQVVATYHMTLFAVSKDGELQIYQPAQSMTDLLVATCLALRMPDH